MISGNGEKNSKGYIFEQALISKKNSHNSFSVEREYINSKEFHDKFEKLPLSKDVQESVYRETGRLFDFVDGQEEERGIAINARTGELLIDNFKRKGYTNKTGFNEKEKL